MVSDQALTAHSSSIDLTVKSGCSSYCPVCERGQPEPLLSANTATVVRPKPSTIAVFALSVYSSKEECVREASAPLPAQPAGVLRPASAASVDVPTLGSG